MAKREVVRIVLLLAAFVAPTGQTAAQERGMIEDSGNYMYSACKAFAEDRVANVELENFCSGVLHGLVYTGPALPASVRFCAPQDSTTRQLARVMIAYMDAHPEKTHEDFRTLAVEAFHQAWPCINP